jgi:hypothetical protein
MRQRLVLGNLRAPEHAKVRWHHFVLGGQVEPDLKEFQRVGGVAL